MSENILVDDENNQVNPEEIKDFLMENEQEQNEQPVQQPEQPEVHEDIDKKPNSPRLEVTPSNLYDAKPSKTSYYNNMEINIADDRHVITDYDKETYLEAMMAESDLQLPIIMKNGLTIVCRDLNMYEREVSIEIAKRKIANKELPAHLIMSTLRDIRLPMQIVSINDKKFRTVRLEYDPESSSDKFEKDMEYLIKQSKATLMRIPSSLQSLYMKALNIFEHKLARLEEAAFNSDFWNPVGRD